MYSTFRIYRSQTLQSDEKYAKHLPKTVVLKLLWQPSVHVYLHTQAFCQSSVCHMPQLDIEVFQLQQHKPELSVKTCLSCRVFHRMQCTCRMATVRSTHLQQSLHKATSKSLQLGQGCILSTLKMWCIICGTKCCMNIAHHSLMWCACYSCIFCTLHPIIRASIYRVRVYFLVIVSVPFIEMT